jgi:hypothetical protein
MKGLRWGLRLALAVVVLAASLPGMVGRSQAGEFGLFFPFVFKPDSTVRVADVLRPFDANVSDLVGPVSWYGNYGKTPEIIAVSNGVELDVLAQDYNTATPWKAVLLHIKHLPEGYRVTQALTGLPMLDRVMGLGADADGNRYYATGVDENALITPTYPPLNTYRSDIVRVIKVDPSGNLLFNIDLDPARYAFDSSAEMIINPMRASTARLAVGGNEIALVHGINTKPDPNLDGRRHQKALSTRLDAATGAVTRVRSVWVSHSFDQRLLFDGTGIIENHLGDAYPRTVVFGRDHVTYPLFYIKGPIGENLTATRLGNVALIENDPFYSYLALFVSESTSVVGEIYNSKINGPRDLAIVRVSQADNSLDPSLPDMLTVISGDQERTNRLRWLTRYTAESRLHAERPKLVALGGDRYIVLWEEWRNKDKYNDVYIGVYAMLIDAAGNALRGPQLLTTDHHLSRGDDAFLLDGRAAWMTGVAAEGKLLLHFVDEGLGYVVEVIP